MTLLFLTFEIDRFGSGAYIYGSMLRRNQVAKGLTRGEESLLRNKVTRVGVRESIVRGLKGTRAEEMRLEKSMGGKTSFKSTKVRKQYRGWKKTTT